MASEEVAAATEEAEDAVQDLLELEMRQAEAQQEVLVRIRTESKQQAVELK